MLTSSLKYSGFDPRAVGGCVLWLDGADSNTVTLSAGNVTAWTDKSGSGYSATAPAGRNPTYTANALGSNNAITCTNAQNLVVSNFVIGQTMSVFTVYAPINNANGLFIEHSADANTNNGFFLNTSSNNNFSIRYSTTQSSVSVTNYGNSNAWQLMEGINPDPNFSNYLGLLVNGVRQGLSSTAALTSNINVTSNLFLNGRASTSTLCSANYIGEILIYNVGLPAKERQAIEGYLTWKWGIQTAQTTFTPTSISGCRLWLDAADASSVTVSGSSVTAWTDKSGTGQTITISSPAPTRVSNSIGTLPAMSFSGGNPGPFFRSTFTSAVSISNHTLFLVARNSNNTYQQTFALGTPGSSPYNNTSSYRIATFSNGADVYGNNGGYLLTSASNTIYSPFPSAAVICHTVSNGTGNLAINDNDPVVYSTYTNFNYTPTTVAGMEMGFLTGSGGGFVGFIGEAILYNVALTTSQRDQVTKYLYRKWSIPGVLELSPTHPSTVARPISRPFQPTDIGSCSLWLDAADPTAVVTSGSTVTRWLDRSGSNNDATRFNASFGPTYTSNVLNGLPGVAFGGLHQNTLQASSNVLNGTNYSMFAVGNYANFTSNQTMCGASRQNYNSMLFFTYTAGSSLIGVYVYPFGNNGADMLAWPTESLTRARVLSVSVASSTSSGVVTIRSGADGSGSIATPTSQNVATCQYPFTIGGYLEGGVASYSGLTGNVHEVIVYQQALNAGQIRQVEGYLANKWGLRANFANANPFKTLPPLMPAFDPRQYGCFQWYDSADPAALILSGSNVTAWNDKSGNGYHLSNADVGFAQSAVEPTTGLRTAHFPTSNIILRTSNTLNYTSSMYIFVAARLTEPSTTTINDLFAWPTLGSANNGNTATRYYQQKPIDGGGPGDANDAAVAFVVNGNQELTGKAYSNYATSTYLAPHLLGFPMRYTTSSTFQISDSAYSRYFIGYVFEVIVLSNAPSGDARQRIEGYLTQKWRRVNDLSASHPFRKLIP